MSQPFDPQLPPSGPPTPPPFPPPAPPPVPPAAPPSSAPASPPPYGAPPAAPPPYTSSAPGGGWGGSATTPPDGPSPTPAGPGGGAGRSTKLVIGLLVVAIIAVLTVGVVVLVGGGDDGGDGDQAGPELAPDEDRTVRPESLPAAASRIEVQGASEGPYGEDMRAAIADVDGYWKREFEPTFGIPYETVSGGFFAVTEDDRQIPCTESASDVEGNAFYCRARTSWPGTPTT
ncbi:hypothetical protein [Dermatobacter hominis]|uniref:hypothetical protein n=1 Tax=Dermatobacter hominis TaxID=2884263 RepID=UPI001D10F7AC|nr:hypothetical protein [Dermatobacter hominis]UDY37123.1 hypothetical protein LH044_06190 [Dermatobacter hominis]